MPVNLVRRPDEAHVVAVRLDELLGLIVVPGRR
jgi:hypothetical protein